VVAHSMLQTQPLCLTELGLKRSLQSRSARNYRHRRAFVSINGISNKQYSKGTPIDDVRSFDLQRLEKRYFSRYTIFRRYDEFWPSSITKLLFLYAKSNERTADAQKPVNCEPSTILNIWAKLMKKYRCGKPTQPLNYSYPWPRLMARKEAIMLEEPLALE